MTRFDHPRFVLASLRCLNLSGLRWWAVRLFGRNRVVRNDDGSAVTLREWRGVEYLWDWHGGGEHGK